MKFDPDRHHHRSIRLKGYDYAQAGAYFVTICAQDRACLFGAITDREMQMNDAGEMIARWWEEVPHKFPSVELDLFVVMPNHFHGIIVLADSPVGADLRVCPDPPRVCPDPPRVCPDPPRVCPDPPRVCPDPPRVCPDPHGVHTNIQDAQANIQDAQANIQDARANIQDARANIQDARANIQDARANIQGAQANIQGAHANIQGARANIQGAHAGAPLRRTAVGEIVQWFKTMATNEYIRGVKQKRWAPFRGRLWQRDYYEHIIRDDADFDRIREYISNNPGNWANDDENPQCR
jgi:REP element-mobilizing transposase RayT